MILRLKSKARRLSTAALVLGALEVSVPHRGLAVELPQASSNWVASGAATRDISTPNTLVINQTSGKAILNWSRFNISADGRVIFNQPGASAEVLNRIHDANPSQIFGELRANGQVYLINQNGFLFGSTARVNTAGLVVSTLSIDDKVFLNGLPSATASAALTSPGNTATISVQPGARLTTNDANQRILLAANRIENGGEIIANDGKIILAAGDSVFVSASDDPELRGLLVEVSGGSADSAVLNTGTVTAERGNITAVGLAINQNGRMTATTSVNINGSIHLLARSDAKPSTDELGNNTWVAHQGGSLTLGAGSVTEVNPDVVDTSTAADEQKQLQSHIELMGKTVQLGSGSTVRAAGGKLSVVAASDPSAPRNDGGIDAGASIHVDAGALIDLSGSIATTSVTRNLLTVGLFGNELADSPLQRNGVLYRKEVVVDARVGTSVADVSGAIAGIKRDVLERTSQGGSVLFDSAGDVVVHDNATVDVSGGAVNYLGGVMQTTQLVRSDGKAVDIGSASKDAKYTGMLSTGYKVVSDRWGVTKTIVAPGIGKYEQGYTDGADAGSIQIMGNAMALNGNFIGQTTPGTRQRSTDTLPQGGTFIVGATRDGDGVLPSTWRAPEITLTRQATPFVSGNNILATGTPLILATDFINNGGFSRVQLASDKAITIAADTPITLGAGGSLSLNAQRININSSVTAHSGSISADTTLATTAVPLNNTGIKLADGVTLDVSGVWTNDAQVQVGQPLDDLIALNGGKISLKQATKAGVLDIGNDVSLLADGGAWLKQSGNIAGGTGGSISLAQDSTNIQTGDTRSFKIGTGLNMRAFGVQGALGGSFVLRAPRMRIDDYAQSLAPQQVNATLNSVDVLNVGTGLFTGHGFSKFNLQADATLLANQAPATSLDVAGTAHVNLQPATLWLDSRAHAHISGDEVSGFAKGTVLPEYLAKSTGLTLNSSAFMSSGTGLVGVNVAQGASITGNAGSTVNIASVGDAMFDGSLNVASGTMNISTPNSTDRSPGFLDRHLVVDTHAQINVAGTTIYTPNVLGLRIGKVFDGGSVNIIAGQGSVDIKSGSVIDVSGTQAELDLLLPGAVGYQSEVIASAGGSLSVAAEETIALQGTLHAQGGVAQGVANTGGSLNVSLKRERITTATTGTPYLNGDRIVELVAHGNAVPANGVASVGIDFIANSGVDSVSIAATNKISVAAGTDLSLKRSLTLDTSVLEVSGSGTARLNAASISAGNGLSSSVVASGGSGQLTLQADQLTLKGVLALSNISQANFISKGDIALMGYGIAGGGQLRSAGDVNFTAQRVLPTTGSTYTVNAPGKTVTFAQNGSNSGTPLSAAGQLTVNAANIVQGGSVYAPFGSITFNGSNTVQLLEGSVTSVSGNGTLIPYGRVDNGTTWVWGREGSTAAEITASPRGTITLNGNSVDMSAGSILDVSGGGDLLAYQYTPGTGGKQDVLNPTSTGYLKNTYAIMPASAAGSITYDPLMWENSGLQIGQSVYLDAGSGVPAGVYQLLPPRYALTPGAYLVTALGDFQDLPAGTTATTVDGAKVVSGYFTFGASQNAAARTTGFSVRSGDYARARAQYDGHLASTFFGDKATKAGITALLPDDAGSVVISATQSLTALGDVLSAGNRQGRNANIDVAAGTTLEIDSGVVTSGTTGVVHLSSEALNNWHAGSLVLGGNRDGNGAMDVKTSNVIVHGGATLSADEIILAASNNLTVESGAVIASNSASNAGIVLDDAQLAQTSALKLTGSNADNAAVLAVSDRHFLVADRGVARNGVQAGALTLQTNAQITTRGALLADAAGTVSIADDSINAAGASWALGSSNVALGGNSAANTLVVNDSLLSGLQSARAIALTSEHDITINQATTLGSSATATNSGTLAMALQADRIVNAIGANSVFNAGTLNLSGINSQSGAVTTGAGELVFNANEVRLGKNQIGIGGVTRTTLNSDGLITATAAGGINVAGDLNLVSTAISAGSGAQGQITTTGTVTTSNAAGDAPAAHDQPMGGELSIDAQNIVAGGRILMPSGVVNLNANNAVQLQDAAVIDVSGYQPVLADSGSDGGAINIKTGGNLDAASGSMLNVSAGPHANAGSIAMDVAGTATLAGSYRGTAGVGGDGGQFMLRANALNDFSGLNQTLESAQGGFTEQRSYRVATGDLSLAQGQTITARQIELTSDSGAVNIDGSLIAHSGDRRSHIEVNAHNNVTLGNTAVLDVDAVDATTQKAGSILLNSTTAELQLASAATVQARGKDQSGNLTLRAAATGNNFNNLVSLPADLSKVDTVVLQPIKSGGVYTLSSSTLGATQFNAMRSDLVSYVSAAAGGTLLRLNLTGASNVVFRPYADIVRAGDLNIGSYDFGAAGQSWRFANGEAATVSVRATGNVTVDGTLSDGFVNNGGNLDLSSDSHSVGVNIVAGADFNAASNHDIARGSTADLTLNDGSIVRTGTGDINLTAASDVDMGELASVYTGGKFGADTVFDSGGFVASFASRGGSIVVNAGNDVIGNITSQYAVTDWQVRWAPYKADGSGPEATAYWGTDYSRFDWNFGALGGGDVTVHAGNNVNDVSIAVVDSMANNNGVRTALGGGNLAVTAKGDIDTGYFYVAKGRGDLSAGGEFGTTGSRTASGRGLGSFFLAGDTRYRLSATRDVLFEGVAQPSLLEPTQFSSDNESFIYFARYGAASELALLSHGGNVKLNTGYSVVAGTYGFTASSDLTTPYPASVAANAFGGDVVLDGSPTLVPSAQGQLSLFAARDIVGNGAQIAMSDVDISIAGLSADKVDVNGASGVVASIAASKSQVLHSADALASAVYAGRDINDLGVKLAEAVTVQAGRDIRNLALDVQQSGAATTSQVIAGRDLYYTSGSANKEISVAGSGVLEVLAGRDLNLGVTKGIVTTGNLLNGNLPDGDGVTGANVVAMAGLTQPMSIDGFVQDIVATNATLQASLVDFVKQAKGQSDLDFVTAMTLFNGLNVTQQRQFAVKALFAELVASGQEATAQSSKGYSRGFAAIKSLFPGSQDSNSPYSGDISLPFSRIYTLNGGTIAMLAPGGKINVGLANAPTTLTGQDLTNVTNRRPSELGIVAQGTGDVRVLSQGDVLVNSSRIFTLGGGDIDIWSSAGNIDAGKGAKSSLSAPPPTVSVDASGNVTLSFSGAVSGSGIRTILTSGTIKQGNVNLMAPVGSVNAGDAGVGSAGNLTIAAQRVVGLDNIQVSGTSSGVPPETSGLGASLSAVTAASSGASNAASNTNTQVADKQGATSMADTALSWLDVFVVGLGEENCKQDDLECLRRQSTK